MSSKIINLKSIGQKEAILGLIGIYASYKVICFIGSKLRLGQRIFNKVWTILAPGIDAKLHKNKTELFSQAHGKVLDVGSGYGPTLNYLVENKDVNECFAIEPNPFMLPRLEGTVKKIGDKLSITILNKTILEAIRDSNIQPESFDTVICNLVLCSIPNPKQTLLEIQQCLKPNGKLIFIEHVVSKSIFNYMFQTCINPLWGLFTDNCSLTRSTGKVIQEMDGWDKVIINEIPNLFIRHVSGVAVKK